MFSKLCVPAALKYTICSNIELFPRGQKLYFPQLCVLTALKSHNLFEQRAISQRPKALCFHKSVFPQLNGSTAIKSHSLLELWPGWSCFSVPKALYVLTTLFLQLFARTVRPGLLALTFTWWGCCGLCPRPKPTDLTDVLFASSIFMSVFFFFLYGLFNFFHSINPPDNSLLSHSVFFFFLSYLFLSTIYLFMKVYLALI